MNINDDVLERAIGKIEQRFLKRDMIAKAARDEAERERCRNAERDQFARAVAGYVGPPKATPWRYSTPSGDGGLGFAVGIAIGMWLGR